MRPTAPPVLIPELLLFFDTGATSAEFGGDVGVIVTVWTCPVTVSREVTGVGVHMEELELEEVEVEDGEVVASVGVGVVAACVVVVDVTDVD